MIRATLQDEFMGIYDREYMADSKRGTGFRSWSIITWLIVVNIAIYLVQHLIFDNRIAGYVNLSKDTLFSGQVWRLVTFQFCHADIGHLFGNMLGLFFLGKMFEQVIGSRWVLQTYLFGGLLGGLAHILWGMGFANSSVVGASASVLAIVIAVIVTIPEQTVSLLFLPFQFKIKYFGWVILAINVIGLFGSLGSETGISYIAHLGGMAAGWLSVKHVLPHLKEREATIRETGKKPRSKIAEAAEEQIKKKREKETVYLNKKVDTILEKISQEGMQSLTAEERRILERSSEKLSKKLDDK